MEDIDTVSRSCCCTVLSDIAEPMALFRLLQELNEAKCDEMFVNGDISVMVGFDVASFGIETDDPAAFFACHIFLA